MPLKKLKSRLTEVDSGSELSVIEIPNYETENIYRYHGYFQKTLSERRSSPW